MKLGRKKSIDIVKVLNVEQTEADRIAGGMMRLNGERMTFSKYIKTALSFADTPEGVRLVWYFVGYKAGAQMGFMIPISPGMDKPEDKPENDVSIQ